MEILGLSSTAPVVLVDFDKVKLAKGSWLDFIDETSKDMLSVVRTYSIITTVTTANDNNVRGVKMCNIDEIMDMLDWDESEETQQKGIELAKDIKYLDAFIQPSPGKSVWENCAKVLVSRSDEELNPHLYELLDWLKDSNWPGAIIIQERLKAFTDFSMLCFALKSRVSEAVVFNKGIWLRNMSELLDNENLRAVLPEETLEGLLEYSPNRMERYLDTSEILDMLDWNNPLEVQEKGIELGRKVKSYDFLILPMKVGQTKNVWENCAKILVEKSDKELSKCLFKIIIWLEDMSYPGARIILERLKKFSEIKFLSFSIKFCVEKADQIKNYVWLKNMAELLENDKLKAALTEETIKTLQEHCE